VQQQSAATAPYGIDRIRPSRSSEQAFRLQGRHAPRLGVLLDAAELEGDHDL
jgi:hypothetical protein